MKPDNGRPQSRFSPFQTAQPASPVNSQGFALPTIKSRSSRFVTNVVPAGGFLTIPCAGTQFYVTEASGPFLIRPSGGDFNSYESGTGLNLDLENAFNLLEVKNESASPVAFRLFYGFDGFIDNRLFLINGTQTIIARPTYPTPNALTAVPIEDISGQQFTDINGVEWYAIQRDHLIISNTDTGTVILVQAGGALTGNGPAVAAVQPATSIRLDYAGDFSLNVGGGNVNAIVSEAYVSIPKL